MIHAVACQITPVNYPMIISEGVYKIPRGKERAALQDFVESLGTGFYIRDEISPFDCHLLSSNIFHQLYTTMEPVTGEGWFKVLLK